MEHPKKRKYPALEEEERVMEVMEVKEEPRALVVEEGFAEEQHAVVSSEGGGPAKRNRRSYSLEFKVAVLDSFYKEDNGFGGRDDGVGVGRCGGFNRHHEIPLNVPNYVNSIVYV